MSSLVATADPGTGTILVTLEQTIARDTYTRVVAGGWGSPTAGPAYVLSGAAAQYAVNGSAGTITVNVVDTTFTAVLQTNLNDHDIQIQLGTNTIPTGGSTHYGATVRYTSLTNSMQVYAVPALVTGLVTLVMAPRVGGTVYTLDSTVTSLSITTDLTLRVRACGNRFMSKIWATSTPEPEAWTQDITWPGLPTGTSVGALARRPAGSLTPTVFEFDNLVATVADGPPSSVDRLQLFRVTPDGVETEVSGSPFSTNPGTASADTATATFWDPDPPFDVDVFYRMKSLCGETSLTSNTVSLDSDGFGWLRDPTDPSRNFAISLEDFYDECIDQDVIVFGGLGGPEYANASGIFDLIDAARPRTISQTRKNYASSLSLVSFSLDDILDVEDILAPGSVLSLSLPTIYGWALRTYGTDYITIGDVSQSYIGVDQRVTARGWTLPFRLSQPPVDTSPGGTGGNGVGGGGATFDDLAASVIGTTFNSLTASGFTFDQIAAGTGY